MADQVLIPREQVVYLVPEATAGTLTAPTSSSATVIVGAGTVNQNPSYSESEEVANSRSILAHTRDLVPAGEWSLQTYLRPSGSAGTAPAEATLLEALLGTETVSTAAGTVTYTPAVAATTFSLWWKGNDNAVLFARGCTTNTLNLTAEARGYPTCEWGGGLMRLGWCGESTLTGQETAGSTDIIVDDIDRFAPGGLLTIGDETATHTISAVATATATLTLSAALAGTQSAGSTLTPYLPATQYSGTPAEARNASLTLDAVATKYRSFSLAVENNTEFIEDEVDSTAEYPSAYVPGVRRISGQVGILFRSNDVAFFGSGMSNREDALVWAVDDGAGKIVTITLPQALLQVPQVSEAAPAYNLEMSYTARATSAGEDEISWVYS